MKKLLFILVLTLSCAVSCLALPPIPQNKVESYKKEVNLEINKSTVDLSSDLDVVYKKALRLQREINFYTDVELNQIQCEDMDSLLDELDAIEMAIWQDILKVVQKYVNVAPYVPATSFSTTLAEFLYKPYLQNYSIKSQKLTWAVWEIDKVEKKVKSIRRASCGVYY